MCAYTLMISCTSTIAYGVIFATLFHLTKTEAILLGGGVVVFYYVLGGMWSIPLTDFAKANEGAPTDPKVFEQQQQKLQEELQRRAEEARKRLETAPK